MTKEIRYIELLAPAKNVECGIEAVNHGADAVYIGAEKFGARAEAGNSLDGIRRLTEYAHQYGCRVYVTVNTIIYDNEIATTEKLIRELYEIGIDALIIQDLSILKMDIPPIALHASTQMDNRTVDKVRWLEKYGFRQTVLARELTIDEISYIHKNVPNMTLEAFVHGALCVSYSGQCYASQYCFGRSANRGECAQFCRLKFDLEDAENHIIEHDRHLLSLKDMNQMDMLEEMIQAGVSSFKIEGRLKDVSYVKNVTAAYNQRLNEICKRHPEYRRTSFGSVDYNFTPSVEKSFNRGFTHYFIHGRTPGIFSFDTPKAMGEYVGVVKEIRGNSFNVAGLARFVNGDGLCFIDDKHELQGFRVNRVENNRLYPLRMPNGLHPGLHLYRNSNHEFESLLSKPSAVRKIRVRMCLSETSSGFMLTAEDETGRCTSGQIKIEKQIAKTSQRENIERQLAKLGNTIYVLSDIKIDLSSDWFIPSGMLAEIRRNVIDSLSTSERVKLDDNIIPHVDVEADINTHFYASPKSYLYNVANKLSGDFYEENGIHGVMPAFELQCPKSPLIMQCRYCLRYALGYCVKNGGEKPTWHEPLYLVLPNKKRFRLEFDCKNCQMNIYAE
jgi:collagenase-like PrtC family protease